jgi:hypothetical protein
MNPIDRYAPFALLVLLFTLASLMVPGVVAWARRVIPRVLQDRRDLRRIEGR